MAFGIGIFNGFGLSIEHRESSFEQIAWTIEINIGFIRFFIIKLADD